MKHHLSPIQIWVIALAGGIDRKQQAAIEYLLAENRILKGQCKGKRIQLSDSQRRLLAAKAKAVGRKMLRDMETRVTPDTLLSWHRKLIARKWKHEQKQVGRPRISQEVIDLVVRFARENTTWGYDRIQGALENLSYQVAPNTVKNVLKRQGIEPAPE